ncbi:pimeloyl-ACP methyl ester carboxylesterase [Bradyrhizobium japonicum]|uniref:alpha/beta hydrolase n=1 Tax=Bradyrhizobium TaxID=374 RepID=UPI00039B0E08|nr:alpha/beta hydrolase [Bradyrhizobium elkanii]MCP1733330.1 pimeloyl-ACP methyl ester carboxylesterase [Bradyrhizobium elkanii]MCS3568668.1 pimeloyl-ACP methyl ester carboxylesterase [Bradyrhizobium elkanii]MCS3589848.1 pimeloyl-ACP methyl ester carboxylesterase [Bradyrhizobium elkanii]MCS3619290.1 pimeloyl-ACP methyl ester carboxylesterase [Bradyrhizobium elkanii]MCS3693893.1 pimeloyl-ACP methyl ester carboxylesterase [Bradyrhizobium elkanii]
MRKQNFVLVHGAWHGGWCWSRTVDCLNPYNEFAVFAPTLTGLGERGHLTSPIPTLDTHIEDIVRVITYNDLHDVVLVGHSYAGMVVTGVADFLGPRLKHIVYLDAAVPEEGDDFASHAPGTTAEEAAKKREWFMSLAKDGVWIGPPDPNLAGVSEPTDVDWLKRMLTPHPVATWLQPVRLRNGGAAGIPKTYILATNPAAEIMGYPRQAERAKRGGDWRFRSIDCGHDTMVVRPKETAELLVEAATA